MTADDGGAAVLQQTGQMDVQTAGQIERVAHQCRVCHQIVIGHGFVERLQTLLIHIGLKITAEVADGFVAQLMEMVDG